MLRLNDIKARFEGQHIHDEDEIELVTEVELRWADSRSTPAHLCIWRAENEKDPDHIAVSLYFPEGSDQAALEIPMERGEWTIENVAEVFGIPMDAAIWEAEKAE